MLISQRQRAQVMDSRAGGGKGHGALREMLVVIPAYNEARFIGSVVLRALRYAARVIVVDDGSTDDTARIARDAGADVLHHKANLGKAAALNTGFLHVKKLGMKRHGIKVVAVLDGDGQHDCRELPLVTAPILSGEADLVVGSRFLGAKSRIPRWRILGQHALTIATNLGSGYSLTDSQSGFRAFSPRVIDLMDFEAGGFSVESEMQFLAQEHQLRVREVPIHAVYREAAKRNPVSQGMDVLRGIARLVGQYRPLLYFSIAGTTLLLAGAGWGMIVIERFNATQHLAVGYAMICLLLSIIGMILISTGFMLHSVRGLLTDFLRHR
jgi:glycosyltransferase involved in cell wall biosynthesis